MPDSSIMIDLCKILAVSVNELLCGERIEMEIKKIAYDFSICKVEDYSLVNLGAEYCFVGKTDEEKSLVCLTCDVPGNVTDWDDGW